MQAPTHVLVGVLIEKTFNRVRLNWLRVILIAATGLLLHSVFDRIARLTFHPPDADFTDAFWVGYHLLVLAGFIVSLYYFWRPYKLGIIFSILPDFDWVIIHGKNILGIDSGFYSEPYIHKSVHFIIDHIPPFSWLQHLPDLTHLHWAVLVEVFIFIIMLYIIFYEPLLWSSQDTDEMDIEEAD